MRTMTKVLTVAATLVLALSLAAPLEASCGAPVFMTTTDLNSDTSFIINTAFQNFVADGVYTFAGTGPYGPYTFSSDPLNPALPPLSAAANITFWRVGTGDPAIGVGDDSGSYDMIATGGFYFSGTLPTSTIGGYLRGGQMVGLWDGAGIDGCIEGNNCMCLLITDQNGTDGEWALLGGISTAGFNTFLDIGGTDGVSNLAPILLVSLDKLSITGSTRLGNLNAEVAVTLGTQGAGVYVQDGCQCGPLGFKVLQQLIPGGNMPPSDRDAGAWSEPTLADGTPQGVTPFGASVNILSECGASDTDVYLTSQLVFESGFNAVVVSSNSTRIECGPTLATPKERPVLRDKPRGDRPRPRKR